MDTSVLQNKIESAIGENLDTSREYEVSLTRLVNTDFDISTAESLLHELRDMSNMKIAYAVFYCVNIYHRSLFNVEKLDEIWTTYSGFFDSPESYPSINHLRVNRFRVGLTADTTLRSQEDNLTMAYNLCQKYHNNAGYLHSFCALFASLLELNETSQDNYEKLLEKWKHMALKSVDAAINLDDQYAKYYCTKGRILSARGEYDNADREICMAIAKEDSSRGDYAVRIGDYQYYRLQNQLRRQQNLLNKEEESINTIKNSIVSNIETIALFSGIISFVLGSLSLADGNTAVHAGLLIFILMGCLTTVFSVFTLLLHAGDSKYKKITALLVAICSLVVSSISVILSGVLNV